MMEVILHYVFKLVVFTFASSICWIVLVMYSSFPRPWSGWVFLTSLSSYAFSRPCVGRIEYLFVLVLDVLNIYSSMGWTYWIFTRPWVGRAQILCPRFLPHLIFGRVYPVMKGILAFHLCHPENFLVHGLVDLNKNLNKSNMEIMHSHNTMYIT